MQKDNLKPFMTQCVNSRSLFESFEETYEDYYYCILTTEKPFITWIYLRSLPSHMEKEGIYLPTILSQRF